MRKLLAAFVFVLILPALGFGAITSIGSLSTGCTSTTSGTTCVITTTATVEVNNIVVLRVAADNFGAVDGATTQISAADSAGNTYTRICEYTYADGGAGNGATAAVFIGRASSQLTSGGTITTTFANAITAKVGHAQELGVTAGNTLQLGGTCQTENIDSGTDPDALTVTGLVDGREYYFLRLHAIESQSNGHTETTNYVESIAVAANTGVSATSMHLTGERRILTLSGATSETSNPTVTGAINDGASIFVALEECTPKVNCTGDVVAARPRPPIIVQ